MCIQGCLLCRPKHWNMLKFRTYFSRHSWGRMCVEGGVPLRPCRWERDYVFTVCFRGAAPGGEFSLMTTQRLWSRRTFYVSVRPKLTEPGQRWVCATLRAISQCTPSRLSDKRHRQQQRSNWSKNRPTLICHTAPSSSFHPAKKAQPRDEQNNPITVLPWISFAVNCLACA